MLYFKPNILLLFVLVLVSFTYAVVGYGRASDYLGLMVFCAFVGNFKKATSLVLNVEKLIVL